MLEAYKRLEAAGVIGRMMKVGTDGKTIIIDPSGEQPGQLVQRPFYEYPKAVRRVRVKEDGTEEVITLVAHSKAEELKIMSDTVELEAPRSPLERERDQLAEDLATERKMSAELAKKLEQLVAKVDSLSRPVVAAPAKSAEAKAVTNQK